MAVPPSVVAVTDTEYGVLPASAEDGVNVTVLLASV